MKLNLEVLPEAEEDIHIAANYFEGIVPLLGDQFLKEVDGYINLIVENPKSYAVKYQ